MCFSVSSKSSLQDFAVLHFRHIYQTPAREPTTAPSTHLIAEQADNSVLNTVIVWLSYPLLRFVSEAKQMFRSNGLSQKAVRLRTHLSSWAAVRHLVTWARRLRAGQIKDAQGFMHVCLTSTLAAKVFGSQG